MSERGIFPAKNWSATGEFLPAKSIGWEPRQSRKIGQTRCAGCPVGCGQLSIAKTGRYAGVLSEGPEFETVYAMGGQTGVEDLDSIIASDRLADELGLDTVSTGSVIAFAMELFEKGILTTNDTEGLDLRFGNHEAMIEIIQKIAQRIGLGDVLADGVKVAAQKIGKGAEEYAVHVKGLELPGYDPRGVYSFALHYATCYTGADHCKGYAIQEIFGETVPFSVDPGDIEGKGAVVKWNQDVRAATLDSATMCGFVFDMALAPFGLQNTASLMHAVTNISYAPEDVLRVGERITNLARCFNVRDGFGREQDTLPKRLMSEPIKDGPAKGKLIREEELSLMLDEYYEVRGWDAKTGKPTREKLTELGLAYAADELRLQ